MKLIGVDFGKKVGLAITDPLNITCYPLSNFEFVDIENALCHLQKAIEQNGPIEKIVVGVPYGLKKQLTESTKKALDFIDKLKKSLAVEVVAWDERYSTVAADRCLGKASRYNKKQKIDAAAAAFMLQGYVDFIRSKKP